MRTLIIIPILLFSLLLGAPSYSADVDKGWDAFNEGDFVTAFKEFKPFADEGNSYYQFTIGWMYLSGKGIAQDYVEAVYWFRLAAEQ